MEKIDYSDDAWVDHFLPLAEAGDPAAQIAVGWEYVRGTHFEKNTDTAAQWFRKAQQTADELAIFNLMKLYYIENDGRLKALFHEREEWELGAIYLAYGLYNVRNGDVADGRKYLKLAVSKGNLIAKLHLIDIDFKSVLGRIFVFPYRLFLAIKLGIIQTRNPRDDRILV